MQGAEVSGLHRVGWGVRPQVSRASGSWSSAFGYRVNVREKRKKKWFSFTLWQFCIQCQNVCL